MKLHDLPDDEFVRHLTCLSGIALRNPALDPISQYFIEAARRIHRADIEEIVLEGGAEKLGGTA